MHTKRIPQVCRHSRKQTKSLSKAKLEIGTKSRQLELSKGNTLRREPKFGTISIFIFGTTEHTYVVVFLHVTGKILICKDKNFHHRHNLHGQLAGAIAPALNSEI